MNPKKIFISSVQSEFAEERRRICDYIRCDALLGKFFEPFIFEEMPAVDITSQEAYLFQVKQCDIYLGLAHSKRGFKIPFTGDNIPEILTHLNLMSESGQLTNSALLLFAKNPQKFFVASEVKCMVFPTNLMTKPILSYQVYQGGFFELVDQARSFVMQHIDSTVGTRSFSNSVDITYEIPMEVVSEAIVNACVHRSYENNGSVQVMIFKDRLEVWNPGTLPLGLTPEKLKQIHSSIPVNPILAAPVYLAGYIERAGTGTTDMVTLCRKVGLDDPEFIQDEDFRIIIRRKNVTQNVTQNGNRSLKRLKEEFEMILSNRSISIEEVARHFGVTVRTVRRDLNRLRETYRIEWVGPSKTGHWEIEPLVDDNK